MPPSAPAGAATEVADDSEAVGGVRLSEVLLLVPAVDFVDVDPVCRGLADPVADGAVLVGSVVEEPAARDVELGGAVVPPPLVVLDCVGCGRVVLVVGFGSAGGAMPGVRPAPKARPIAVPGVGLREAAPLLL